uniref:Uncharacterized protein n=1 Tax=Poecilia reticulata TaxID=8081 RepID=A0A3P9PTG5_POERE
MFPVTCLTTGDTYKPPREVNGPFSSQDIPSKCFNSLSTFPLCFQRSENKILKRFYPTDYDNFVGLMGKRQAASATAIPDYHNAWVARKTPIFSNLKSVILSNRRFSGVFSSHRCRTCFLR